MQTKPIRQSRKSGAGGFTLAETLVSILIMGMFFSATLLGYTRATERAEWAGYSLAAQAQGSRQLEEFSSVLWDTQVLPIHDDTTNVPRVLVMPLDLPVSGTNVVFATNTATVTTINVTANVQIKMIRIDTTWPWKGKTYTNTIVSYRAPDQ